MSPGGAVGGSLAGIVPAPGAGQSRASLAARGAHLFSLDRRRAKRPTSASGPVRPAVGPLFRTRARARRRHPPR